MDYDNDNLTPVFAGNDDNIPNSTMRNMNEFIKQGDAYAESEFFMDAYEAYKNAENVLNKAPKNHLTDGIHDMPRFRCACNALRHVLQSEENRTDKTLNIKGESAFYESMETYFTDAITRLSDDNIIAEIYRHRLVAKHDEEAESLHALLTVAAHYIPAVQTFMAKIKEDYNLIDEENLTEILKKGLLKNDVPSNNDAAKKIPITTFEPV